MRTLLAIYLIVGASQGCRTEGQACSGSWQGREVQLRNHEKELDRSARWHRYRDRQHERCSGNDRCGAKLADVVTVTGVVHTDKDFGSGYFYKVLFEDATLQPCAAPDVSIAAASERRRNRRLPLPGLTPCSQV